MAKTKSDPRNNQVLEGRPVHLHAACVTCEEQWPCDSAYCNTPTVPRVCPACGGPVPRRDT